MTRGLKGAYTEVYIMPMLILSKEYTMSDRALFYAMVLVFLIGSTALFLGASAGSTLATMIGFIGWIGALALLVFWFFRKKKTVVTE